MPWKPKKPGAKARCSGLTDGRFCEAHQVEEARRYDRQRGSASRRGYDRWWRKLAARILRRDPVCKAEWCNKASTEVDHIIPRRRGGSDDPGNLQGLCLPCHSRKTALEDGRWSLRGRRQTVRKG